MFFFSEFAANKPGERYTLFYVAHKKLFITFRLLYKLKPIYFEEKKSSGFGQFY